MRIIVTSKGAKAKVDDSDFEWLNQYSWHLCRGYMQTTVGKRPNRRNLYMHRLIMGEPEGMQIDHINRVPLDNRRSNLRICTQAENAQNRGVAKMSKNNTTGVIGVTFIKRENKWRASFQKDGVRRYFRASSFGEAASIANKLRAEV